MREFPNSSHLFHEEGAPPTYFGRWYPSDESPKTEYIKTEDYGPPKRIRREIRGSGRRNGSRGSTAYNSYDFLKEDSKSIDSENFYQTKRYDSGYSDGTISFFPCLSSTTPRKTKRNKEHVPPVDDGAPPALKRRTDAPYSEEKTFNMNGRDVDVSIPVPKTLPSFDSFNSDHSMGQFSQHTERHSAVSASSVIRHQKSTANPTFRSSPKSSETSSSSVSSSSLGDMFVHKMRMKMEKIIPSNKAKLELQCGIEETTTPSSEDTLKSKMLISSCSEVISPYAPYHPYCGYPSTYTPAYAYVSDTCSVNGLRAPHLTFLHKNSDVSLASSAPMVDNSLSTQSAHFGPRVEIKKGERTTIYAPPINKNTNDVGNHQGTRYGDSTSTNSFNILSPHQSYSLTSYPPDSDQQFPQSQNL